MIRRIEEKDYNSVDNLLKKEFHTDFPQGNPFIRWFVVDIGEEIIAFICYSIMYEQLELNYIYVVPNYRRQILASKLMKKMLDDAQKSAVLTMTLEVNEQNKNAQELYKKFGFEIATIRKNYYGNVDGLLMIRKLM